MILTYHTQIRQVLVDLKSTFGSLDNLHLCEIGVGYGGNVALSTPTISFHILFG